MCKNDLVLQTEDDFKKLINNCYLVLQNDKTACVRLDGVSSGMEMTYS
jgi:hypothetical protein